MTTSITSTATQTQIGAGGNSNALVLDATGIVSGVEAEIKSITASVAANALTLGLNPTTLQFRSTPLTSGAVNQRSIAPAALIVPATATLGTVNAVQSRLVLLAIDNAGTVELAVVNIAGGNNLDETTLISTTAISTASDVSNVIYTTTARTGVPFRVVGYVESTQATAGTWATAPSTIQGHGGQAFASMSSLGYGQTWQDVTGSRVAGTTYYNTTGRPILIDARGTSTATAAMSAVVTINGVSLPSDVIFSNGAGYIASARVLIPPGSSYSVTFTSAPKSSWLELR